MDLEEEEDKDGDMRAERDVEERDAHNQGDDGAVELEDGRDNRVEVVAVYQEHGAVAVVADDGRLPQEVQQHCPWQADTIDNAH